MHAADLLTQFVADNTYDGYRADVKLRSAVERQFQILGEALGQMARRDSKTATSVPELARIVAFRNFLIHDYATVDDQLVWGIAESKLPALRETLRRLLGEPGASDDVS